MSLLDRLFKKLGVSYVTKDGDRELYRRHEYDDAGPVHLAARRANSIHESEQTVGNLRAHLQVALAALEGLALNTPIPLLYMEQATTVYEALDQIQYFLPKVVAWCVYRQPDDDGYYGRVYCAATTKEQAERLAKVVIDFESRRQYGKKDAERIIVVLQECDIRSVVHPEMKDKELIRNWEPR